MSRSGSGVSQRAQHARRTIDEYRSPARWRLIRRRSIEEGVFGGSPKWLAIGVLTWGVWVLRKAWSREDDLVYRTRLKPGESLVIRTSRPAR